MKKMIAIGLIAIMILSIGPVYTALAASQDTNPMPVGAKWTEQRDMSKYTNYTPSVVNKTAFDKAWELSHPGGIVFDHSRNVNKDSMRLEGAEFLPDNRVVVTRSADQLNEMADGIASRPKAASAATGETQDGMMALETANVVIIGATYSWYWTQDTWCNNDITIYNNGPSTASGKVIVWSLEDDYGYYMPYSGLEPGASTVVSVGFNPLTDTSVGVKPIALEARVDPDDLTTDFVQMPVDGVEKYNNAYLTDPDGGDSLETSELYHFPYNEGYNIIREAALEGDNTYTPFDTAYQTMTGTYEKMDLCEVTSPAYMYTATDLWIRDNGYIGVCDDYATLFISYCRSLGVPARYYYVRWISGGTPQLHGISEIWDGSSWVHADPMWNTYNNPQVYKLAGKLHVHLTKMSDADDSCSGADPYGDRLLDCWSDFGSRVILGEPIQYN